VDAAGCCYYFDLLLDSQNPIHVESLSSEGRDDGHRRMVASAAAVDFSMCRPGSRVANIAVIDSKLSASGSAAGNVKVRRLRDGIFVTKPDEASSLIASMDQWASRLYDCNFVATTKDFHK